MAGNLRRGSYVAGRCDRADAVLELATGAGLIVVSLLGQHRRIAQRERGVLSGAGPVSSGQVRRRSARRILPRGDDSFGARE